MGVETRTEDLAASVDGLYANGLALGFNPANSFSGGSRSTRGAFLEVGVPLTSPSSKRTAESGPARKRVAARRANAVSVNPAMKSPQAVPASISARRFVCARPSAAGQVTRCP